MRIAVLCYRFIPEIGGYETVGGELASRLAEKGHDVAVITRKTSDGLARAEANGKTWVYRIGEPRKGASRLIDRAIRYFLAYPYGAFLDFVIGKKAGWHWILAGPALYLSNYCFGESSLFGLRELREERELLARLKPEVIQALDIRSTMHARSLAAELRESGAGPAVFGGAPGVYWRFNRFRRGYEKLAFSLTGNGVELMMVHNDGTGGMEAAESVGAGGLVRMYPIGVDSALFDPEKRGGEAARKKLGIREDEFVFGIPARVHKVKGTLAAAEAFGKLGAKNTVLLLVGDAPDKKYLEEVLAAAWKGEGRAVFAGPVQHGELPDYIAAFDAVVYAGPYSNYNVSFAESMVMGKRAVAARADPYTAKFIEGAGEGMLFCEGDTEGFVECLRATAAGRHTGRFSRRVRAAAIREWDWERTVAIFLGAYGGARATNKPLKNTGGKK